MELKQLWTVVVRRWWLILIPAVIAVILTLPSIKTLISPPVTYTVTIRFTASQVPNSDTAKTFQDKSYIPWLASEYAVNNLATWMRTESFAREMGILAKAQLVGQSKTVDSTYENTLRGAISNADSARSIMTLYLRWPDPEEIKVVAQASIEVLRTKNAAYFAQFGDQSAQITPLDGIVVVPEAVQVTTRFAPLIRILIGLAAGIALAFLAEYLDQTIRNRDDLKTLGLSIIGEIPPHR